jgi:hypothetical protein
MTDTGPGPGPGNGTGSDPGSEDPSVIRSIAVTVDDVVTAYEANRQRDANAVVRITPPFAPRMRARIHVGPADYETTPAPIHVRPNELVDETETGPYPTPDRTEDELRADGDDPPNPESHHAYHLERIRSWRRRARRSIVETITIETSDGAHDVTVKPLGTTDE